MSEGMLLFVDKNEGLRHVGPIGVLDAPQRTSATSPPLLALAISNYRRASLRSRALPTITQRNPMTDVFILASDPEALRREGIPLHPATAIQLSKTGDFPSVTRLSPHKSGWFRSALMQFLESKKTAA